MEQETVRVHHREEAGDLLMGKDKDIESLKGIKRDDRNLSIAGRRWEEDIDDPAIEHLRLIREDVEKDD